MAGTNTGVDSCHTAFGDLSWQANSYQTALPFTGTDRFNRALVIGDDSMCNGHSQTRALSRDFCRIERIEEFLHCLF